MENLKPFYSEAANKVGEKVAQKSYKENLKFLINLATLQR